MKLSSLEVILGSTIGLGAVAFAADAFAAPSLIRGGNRGRELQPYPCDPNPCKNGGTCLIDDDDDDGFKCDCPDGWIGRTCEEEEKPGEVVATLEYDEQGKCWLRGDLGDQELIFVRVEDNTVYCSIDDFDHGRVTTDEIRLDEVTWYGEKVSEASCDVIDWDEIDCKITREYDPCDPNPCKNGGTCSKNDDDDDDGFECDCPDGWTGRTCEEEEKPGQVVATLEYDEQGKCWLRGDLGEQELTFVRVEDNAVYCSIDDFDHGRVTTDEIRLDEVTWYGEKVSEASCDIIDWDEIDCKITREYDPLFEKRLVRKTMMMMMTASSVTALMDGLTGDVKRRRSQARSLLRWNTMNRANACFGVIFLETRSLLLSGLRTIQYSL